MLAKQLNPSNGKITLSMDDDDDDDATLQVVVIFHVATSN